MKPECSRLSVNGAAWPRSPRHPSIGAIGRPLTFSKAGRPHSSPGRQTPDQTYRNPQGQATQRSKEINISTVLAGRKLGFKENDDGLRLASFMTCDLGYIDEDTCRLEPIENPFGKNVLPMSPE
ncbi:MAG: hypothetical protein ACTS3R_01975 [Inquilinaceae bacterium]